MAWRRWMRGAAMAGVMAAALACGRSPNGPGPGVNPASCRNYWTAATLGTISGSFTSTIVLTCTFDRPSVQYRCTHNYSDSQGTTRTFNTISTYDSVGDIIDEIKVIPPVTLVRTAATVGGPTVTYTYDSQRRLTRVVGSSTTTYTAWDGDGRPTAGTDVGANFSNTYAIAYDNTQRTRTIGVNGGQVVTVETFDADGNVIRSVATGQGASAVTTMSATNTSTDRVCR